MDIEVEISPEAICDKWYMSFFGCCRPQKTIKSKQNVILNSNFIISKDVGLYDEAMTCLCFRCDKCLKALQNSQTMTTTTDIYADFDASTNYFK